MKLLFTVIVIMTAMASVDLSCLYSFILFLSNNVSQGISLDFIVKLIIHIIICTVKEGGSLLEV